ncbi:hypothetical protein K5P26_04715 [Sphingopyxis sp. XHP0097]|uniref:TIGR04255 family protein n=1 Tax=Sphingopyxis jiangsuensis TaxID=2871171 RepID=A0ABS7MCE1_9SPHN|nr:hypothetical protein [Sphingopyxis jiangsuensis]MBY4636441.1 hypothetical protein [Sphingopyxis jiangsuensis]
MALNFQLRRDAHAIGEFTATLAFAHPVGAAAFSKVVERLKESAHQLNLPAQMNVQAFVIKVGNPPGPPPPSGVGFQRFADNGEIACSLWCDPNGITLTLRDYDRWHSARSKLVEAFTNIAPAYMAEVPAIRAFQLQYLNEFISKVSPNQSPAEIFRSNSRWLAPYAYESLQPWHCHVGQFIPAEEGSRFLININCDAVPQPYPVVEATRNHVKALILVSRQYDLHDIGPMVVEVEQLQTVLEQNFDAAHSLEKTLLGEIISDPYLDVMGEGVRDN